MKNRRCISIYKNKKNANFQIFEFNVIGGKILLLVNLLKPIGSEQLTNIEKTCSKKVIKTMTAAST